MRVEDLTDFFKVRRLAGNPWEVVRFRKGQRKGDLLHVRMHDGHPLFVRGGCADYHMFHRIFLRDEYRVNRATPGSWSWVVDLGANVGMFAARAARLARNVVACEPIAVNFAQLTKNVEGRAGVTPLKVAVAGEPGTLKIFRPEAQSNRTGSFSAFKAPDAALTDDYEEVPATTLDALFEEHGIDRCDLLKIDIEGAEYDVLHAASEATFAKVQRIHGEYHDVRPEDPRTRIEAFLRFLRDKGFQLEIEPHRRKPNFGMFFGARPDAV